MPVFGSCHSSCYFLVVFSLLGVTVWVVMVVRARFGLFCSRVLRLRSACPLQALGILSVPRVPSPLLFRLLYVRGGPSVSLFFASVFCFCFFTALAIEWCVAWVARGKDSQGVGTLESHEKATATTACTVRSRPCRLSQEGRGKEPPLRSWESGDFSPPIFGRGWVDKEARVCFIFARRVLKLWDRCTVRSSNT